MHFFCSAVGLILANYLPKFRTVIYIWYLIWLKQNYDQNGDQKQTILAHVNAIDKRLQYVSRLWIPLGYAWSFFGVIGLVHHMTWIYFLV